MHNTEFDARARGFLFIGDPHVSSGRIGRRSDDYLSSVLAKLAACADLCERFRLVPVILGDLLHRNDDSKVVMLNRLTRTLKAFPRVPLVLAGNHDAGQASLSDEDVLTLLAQTEVVELLGEGGQQVFHFDGASRPTRLWGCPYGCEVPRVLPAFEGDTVLVTHHDLAFATSYPGSMPLMEVLGCQMVVNGHMHDTKPAVQVGGTTWHNPGNIEPLSIDLAHHVPKAWEWVPAMGPQALHGHLLPHGTDLFDLRGLSVAPADAATAVAAMDQPQSAFATLLAAQTEAEAARTDDGAVLAEDLQTVLGAQNASEAVRQLMARLATRITNPG